MPFKFNDTNFPVVTAITTKDMSDEDDIMIFRDYWLKLYERQIKFTFIIFFDNSNNMHLKTAYLLSKMIGEIKILPEQYLKKTIIIFKDQFVINICRLLFSLQPPISQVFLLNANKNNIKKCIKNIIEGRVPEENIAIFDSC